MKHETARSPLPKLRDGSPLLLVTQRTGPSIPDAYTQSTSSAIFLRTKLQAVWGVAGNYCLYCLPSGTGAGPAVWTHGLVPDRHAFRGSYGGYAFPLWDRRRGPAAHNLNPALLDGLSLAYRRQVAPEEAFDAVAALLSATGYTARFAWDLEEAFPHVPFPADPATFAAAARIGAEIRAVESFGRDPAPAFRTARLLGRATGLLLAVPKPATAYLEDGTGTGFIPLQADQSLRLAGLSTRAWGFGVSGYRVLYRWLAARQGEALDAPLQRGILDLAWRVEELLHWCDAADAVLAAAVAAPLTRAALRLAPPAPGAVISDADAPDDSPG